MIRCIILILLTLPASTATAMSWFCSAALQPGAGPTGLPDSPTVFELDLDAAGQFTARGEDRYGNTIIAFNWDGTWTDIGGQIALIGPKRTETDESSEMRAFSTHQGQHELILNLTETAPWTQNVRCLKHDLS